MSSTQTEVSTETPQKDTEVPTETPPIDNQQVKTNPARAPLQLGKNPKRVAAGKLVAERVRIAREQQKKYAAEAAVIIANNKAKQLLPPPDPAPTTEGGEKNSSSLSTTQWLAVASIAVSLIGIYYKREELKVMAKALFAKKTPEPSTQTATQSEPAPATPLRTKMCSR